jgi:hypothetical protein
LRDMPQSDDALSAAALVKAAAGRAGLESPPGVAAIPDSRPYAADPAAPLLTPDDEYDEPADDVRLILDPDPELSSSEGQSRRMPLSWAGSALADFAAGSVAWLASFWLWALIVLAVMVTVLVVILATVNAQGGISRGHAMDKPLLPTQK